MLLALPQVIFVTKVLAKYEVGVDFLNVFGNLFVNNEKGEEV